MTGHINGRRALGFDVKRLTSQKVAFFLYLTLFVGAFAGPAATAPAALKIDLGTLGGTFPFNPRPG